MPLIKGTHIFFHDVVYDLEFFFQSICILDWAGVFEVLFLFLDNFIKFNKVVVSFNTLQSRDHIFSTKIGFGIIEEWIFDHIQITID